MYSRDNSHSSEEVVDFSSVFMRASTSDRAMAEQASAMQMLEDDVVDAEYNGIANGRAFSENRNLSSIITQIQDDGAARPASKRPVRLSGRQAATGTKPVRKPPEPAQHYDRTNVAHKKHTATPVQAYTSSNEDTVSAVEGDEIKSRETGRWQPFLLSLAIAVTAVMGFNLYQLKDQAINMRATLDAYEEQIDELSSTQKKSSDSIVKVSKLNRELTGLKQEITAIKSGYAEIDKKLAQGEVDNTVAAEADIALVKQEVDELEHGLASTRDEMTAIIAAVAEVKGALTPKQAAAPAATAMSTQAASGGAWVVNLASLSSAQQAKIGAAVLEKSGIRPDVNQVVVNGSTVYRLSVKGFSTRGEAVQFARQARQKYGFEGGWVWQS